MEITMTFSEEDFNRIYLALIAHRREMFQDGWEGSISYNALKNLEILFENKADREGIKLG